MVRKIYLFPILFAAVCLSLASCIDDDDDDIKIDEEWKALNEKRFSEVGSQGGYQELSSQSGNGKLYWKYSDEIETSGVKNNLRVTVAGKPEFTDTVRARYEGWYFDTTGKKVIFDSTENPSLRTTIDYGLGLAPSPSPNKVAQKFAVAKVIDGWTTVLQDMTLGEEREICIPYTLGYRSTASTYTPSSSSTTYTMIPAYTTLWFRLKVLDIIPMKGRSD